MSLVVGLVKGQIEVQPSRRTNILNCQGNKLRKMQIRKSIIHYNVFLCFFCQRCFKNRTEPFGYLSFCSTVIEPIEEVSPKRFLVRFLKHRLVEMSLSEREKVLA
jgi:hypothetical protein